MGVAGGLLAKLTPEWFGELTWPQIVLLGLVIAFASLLIVTASLALFRVFRPFAAHGEGRSDAVGEGNTSASDDLSRKIEKLGGEVAKLSMIKSAIIDDYQRMSGLEARVGGDMDGLKLAIGDQFDSVRMGLEVIERKANEANGLSSKVEEIRTDCAAMRRDLEKLEAVQRDDRERRLGSFAALAAMQRLTRLSEQIKLDAASLYDRLKSGEIYDQTRWDQWENVHGHWAAVLGEWLDTATWYALAVKDRTLTVDDAKYGVSWSVSDAQFPNAEAVRRFKKFRIIQQQWEDVVPSVQAGMESVAFTGLTEAEARSGRPAG